MGTSVVTMKTGQIVCYKTGQIISSLQTLLTLESLYSTITFLTDAPLAQLSPRLS